MDPARAVRLVTRPRPLTTRFTRMHAAILRASGGRIRRSRVLGGGQPVLSLTTVGRRSGRRRSAVVAYLRDGDAYAVFGMNLGSESDPAWSHNLAAHPDAEICVDGDRIRVRARRAEGEERERWWRAYRDRLPAVERFQEIAGREVPCWVLEPAG
jgi:F420H(2)-dependent quinone reductase